MDAPWFFTSLALGRAVVSAVRVVLAPAQDGFSVIFGYFLAALEEAAPMMTAVW